MFALPCPPVCKPEAVGRRIEIRAKVEQKRRVIFIEKTEKNQFQLFVSHLLTFRHLKETKECSREIWLSKKRKREQRGRLDYQREEKESNEGDLIIKVKKKRAMRKIWLSKHLDSLSHLHTPPCRKRESSKKQFSQKILKKWTLHFFNFLMMILT